MATIQLSQLGAINEVVRTRPIFSRCLIVDHELSSGQLLQYWMKEQEIFLSVELASDGQSAVSMACDQLPLFVITELKLMDMNGIELTRDMYEHYSSVNILGYSRYASPRNICAMYYAGAGGCIAKDSDLDALMIAIHRLLAGERMFDQAMLDSLTEKDLYEMELSLIDIQIAEWSMQGLTAQQIAELECFDRRTIEDHRSRIMSKLDLPNIHALGGYIERNGFFLRTRKD